MRATVKFLYEFKDSDTVPRSVFAHLMYSHQQECNILHQGLTPQLDIHESVHLLKTLCESASEMKVY